MPPTPTPSWRSSSKATKVPPTPFVKSPPMTLDDELKFESARLAHGVPLVASRFDSMTGATTGLALRLDGVPARGAALPVAAARAAHPRRRDRERPARLLRADERAAARARSSPSTRPSRPTRAPGRVELVLRGSGVGLEESKRAIDWMALVLHAPDWRSENLPRIRDLVDQQLAGLRNTMQARRGELGQRPGQRLAHAAPARLPRGRFLPHPQRTTRCACAGC